jgi:hypothetical protein
MQSIPLSMDLWECESKRQTARQKISLKFKVCTLKSLVHVSMFSSSFKGLCYHRFIGISQGFGNKHLDYAKDVVFYEHVNGTN